MKYVFYKIPPGGSKKPTQNGQQQTMTKSIRNLLNQFQFTFLKVEKGGGVEGREGYYNSAHEHDFTGVYLMDFLLLRYSAIFTVVSLSLLYLLFIS